MPEDESKKLTKELEKILDEGLNRVVENIDKIPPNESEVICSNSYSFEPDMLKPRVDSLKLMIADIVFLLHDHPIHCPFRLTLDLHTTPEMRNNIKEILKRSKREYDLVKSGRELVPWGVDTDGEVLYKAKKPDPPKE